jgi:hypothetical protein
MRTGSVGDHAAPRRAYQKTLLEQKRFHNGFEGYGVFSQGCRQGFKPNGATSMLIHQHGEQATVTGIKATVIHAMQAERLRHHGVINRSLPLAHTGHIPDATQQTIGNPWCPPA